MDFAKKVLLAAIAFGIMTDPVLEARGGAFASRGGNAGMGARPAAGGRGGTRGGFEVSGSRQRNSNRSRMGGDDSIQRPLSSHGNQLYGPAFNPRNGKVDLSSGRGNTPSRSELQRYLDNSGKSSEFSDNKVSNIKNAPEASERGSVQGQRREDYQSRKVEKKEKKYTDPNDGEVKRNRTELAGSIRDHIDQRFPDRKDWFNKHFWDSHQHPGNYFHHHYNWWNFATWIGIAGWLGWPEGIYPVYYGYGYGYPVQGYSTSTLTAQAPIVTYSGQTAQIDSGDAEKDAAAEDWMPLGVFALARSDAKEAAPNMYLQLALNKKGRIAGTYYNAATDKTYGVQGFVSKDTRQASWKLADTASSPIASTGLYNLTENESPVRIHFQDGSSQDWLLIRLKQPDSKI